MRDADGRQVGEVELAGRKCRILLVDGVIPHHVDTAGGKGVRLTYAQEEIAHFEFGGHLYALVEDLPCAREGERSAEKTYGIATDINKLLTNREMQIVQLVSMGLLTKQIADRLRISEFTVRSYLKTIYVKLGVRSRAALVFCYMKAFSEGVLPAE